jgi:DNA-binding response OmpR family regulator
VFPTRAAKRVLVADDDPAILKVVEVNLRAEGMVVETASDGVLAHELATAHPFDLVILDISMPGRDGLSILRELKELPATAHTPVILLSARTADADIWQGWQSGADYYLTKPFNVEELLHYTTLAFGEDDESTAPSLHIG